MAILQTGQSLTKGQSISSDNGAYTLTLQDDGNLVLAEGGNPVWSSQTNGSGSVVLTVQSDGNVVLYTESHDPKWATNTKGDGVRLDLQNDRNLVVYGGNGSALWSSQTATDTPPPTTPAAEEIEEPAAPEAQTYVVAGGDTLSAIAQKFYGDPNLYTKIAEANGIENPDLINVGQELRIPAL